MTTTQDIKNQIANLNKVAGTEYTLEKGFMGHGYKIGNKVFQNKESARSSVCLCAQLVENGDWSTDQVVKNFNRI